MMFHTAFNITRAVRQAVASAHCHFLPFTVTPRRLLVSTSQKRGAGRNRFIIRGGGLSGLVAARSIQRADASDRRSTSTTGAWSKSRPGSSRRFHTR